MDGAAVDEMISPTASSMTPPTPTPTDSFSDESLSAGHAALSAIDHPDEAFATVRVSDDELGTPDDAQEQARHPISVDNPPPSPEHGTRAQSYVSRQPTKRSLQDDNNDTIHQVDGEDREATIVRPSHRMQYRVSSVDRAIRSFFQVFKPAAPVLDSQIYMTTGGITASFILMACSVIFRLEIYDLTRMNSGLLFGSIGTIVMCAFIIATYIFKRWYHTRHMHVLLVNLAGCEFLLAISFILEPVWKTVDAGVGNDRSCTWLSTVREYLIMCSTVWTTCMAVDLYYLMTDPFTSPRLNRRKYRAISNAMATIAAVVMGFFNAFDAPVAVGNFCWVGAKKESQNDANLSGNLGIWLFIIIPVCLSMGTNIYVTFASYNRFRDGMSATLQNREVLLREGFLTTITFIVYSALLWGVYAGYWLASDESTASEVLSVLFAFLLSYRGSVAFILWCLYKKPSKNVVYTEAALANGVEVRAGRRATDRNTTDEASEEAVRPQMNVALLNELVQYTTEGIAKALCMAPTVLPGTVPVTDVKETNANTFTLRTATSRFSAWNEIKFTDFYPSTFARLRGSFGIQDDAFLASLAKCTTPKVSEGASGSFMFYSTDRSYIVKSLTAGESAFLHSFLDRYVHYMTSQPNTFLTRFLGSYCIQLYDKRAYFVVMENVFDVQHGVSIHQRYDIKGSWIDRNAQKPKSGSEATCRHCNQTFRHGVGRNICPNRAGSHEPNVVLKDMDLSTKLRFGPVEGKRLLKQLKRDSDFLCDLGIMDYSLLLGVIEVSYQVNQQNILTRDGSVFLDKIIADTTDAAACGTRMKQSTQCLRTSEVVIGPGFYYIGIIDILQTWNWSKRIERFIKSVVFRKDPNGISAMPPKPYRTRFHRKLEEIIHLGHNVVATPRNSSRAVLTEHEYESMRRMNDTTHILLGVPGTKDHDGDEQGSTSDDTMTGQVRQSQFAVFGMET